MVVLALLGLISTILIALLSHSSALVSHGSSVIALNQKARNTVDRLGPYLSTAVGANGQPALTSPNQKNSAPTVADLESYKSIKFTTTEDFLDPNYNPRQDWNPDSPYFNYEIYFDNTTRPTPYRTENGVDINLGQVLIRRCNSDWTPDATYEPQPLGHNIQYFRCHVLTSQNLEVIVHTVGKRKGPGGNMVDVFEEQQSIVTTPAGTYL